MKHIREILEDRQVSLFVQPEEKGSDEWSTFNVARGNSAGAYRVSLPRQPIVVREPHNVLRIVYPHSITFRPAH